jgi:uncharacterized membrane protein YozB (DUF420 family)
MKKLQSLYLSASILALSAMPVSVAHAVESVPKLTPKESASVDPAGLGVRIVNFLLIAAGAIAVIFLIIGGIRYMISSGNSDQIEKAKHTILYAIIGIVIVIFSYVIVNTIQGTKLFTG